MTLPPLAFIGSPGPMELVIIAGIALLLFGNRLPGAMRSMGQSLSSFKLGMKEGEDELNSPSRDKDQEK